MPGIEVPRQNALAMTSLDKLSSRELELNIFVSKSLDESFDWLRINIEEATGTSYTERNSLCLAFYTVRQRRIKLYNHCWL